MTTPTEKQTRRRPGRPRKPQLVPTGKGYSLRYWRTEDGETIRKQVDLGTLSKTIAKARAKRIIAGEMTPEDVGEVETFESAARRIVMLQNISSQRARMSRLERLAFPIIGGRRITDITSTMIKDVIAAGIENAGGRCTTAVKHLFDDLQSVLGALHSDDELPENVCKRIKFAKVTGGIRRVRKPRIVLTDREFERFAAYWLRKRTLREVVVMAISSRFLGGMRTSDLHAWLWEHVDTVGWAQALVPRPKTKKDLDEASPHAIDPQLAYVLERWWVQEGKPLRGPVFPTRRDSAPGWMVTKSGQRYWREGRKAGEPKEPKGVTYAKPLRRLLWEAGVIRPMPGYAAAEQRARQLLAPIGVPLLSSDPETGRSVHTPLGHGDGKRSGGARRAQQAAAVAARNAARAMCQLECEIQTGGTRNSRIDFHSFRRAVATAGVRAGLTDRQAMAITDHADARTFARYVQSETVIVTPEKMLPRILPPQMAELSPAAGSNHNDSRRVRPDSNGGPVASETDGVTSRSDKTPRKRPHPRSPSDDETPPVTRERQNSTPVIRGDSGALRAAIAEALDRGDLDEARDLLDIVRRRQEQTRKAAE